MSLTADELDRRLAAFHTRKDAFVALGHDGARAAALVLDAAGALEGPVLDLGSGMGVMARELARRGHAVESVDVNAEEQEIAASLTAGTGLEARIAFTPADGAALPFADGAFASAVSFNVLHHLADGASVLREVLRVVRPGGILVLADFSSEGFDFATRVHAAEGRTHPEGPVTLDWARGFLAAAGMIETTSGEAHHERFATFRKPAEAARAAAPPAFEALDRAGLFKALDVFAKNWLAHDGSWFLAAEERFGMDTAMDLDAGAWRRFAAAEARRIMEAYAIPKDGGLDALARALSLRAYSFVNPSRIERDGAVLRFFMTSCRVQETRRRKGLPDFPCRPVGEVEFETFARTVDPRITTRCLHCPPDADSHGHCGWEFRLV
ncbi:MAG: class I SAM-dependent methyltransferase [Acidobacteria bacterium]|nr:class I SAM-dependent methyltransferase [Acidobacteriota bacterium]